MPSIAFLGEANRHISALRCAPRSGLMRTVMPARGSRRGWEAPRYRISYQSWVTVLPSSPPLPTAWTRFNQA
jgi:hypothetical protein